MKVMDFTGGPAPKRPRRKLAKELAKGAMIPNPDWHYSKDCQALFENATARGWMNESELVDYFPRNYGMDIPADGGWVQVRESPNVTPTVPPLSVWFAQPLPFEGTMRFSIRPTIFKLVTPVGSVMVWPHECAPVKDVSRFFGQEKSGAILRPLDGRPLFNTDTLFYLQSRGIPLSKVHQMLIHQMKGDAPFWIEFAPQYAMALLRRDAWPKPQHCPFATPFENWAPN